MARWKHPKITMFPLKATLILEDVSVFYRLTEQHFRAKAESRCVLIRIKCRFSFGQRTPTFFLHINYVIRSSSVKGLGDHSVFFILFVKYGWLYLTGNSGGGVGPLDWTAQAFRTDLTTTTGSWQKDSWHYNLPWCSMFSMFVVKAITPKTKKKNIWETNAMLK